MVAVLAEPKWMQVATEGAMVSDGTKTRKKQHTHTRTHTHTHTPTNNTHTHTHTHTPTRPPTHPLLNVSVTGNCDGGGRLETLDVTLQDRIEFSSWQVTLQKACMYRTPQKKCPVHRRRHVPDTTENTYRTPQTTCTGHHRRHVPDTAEGMYRTPQKTCPVFCRRYVPDTTIDMYRTPQKTCTGHHRRHVPGTTEGIHVPVTTEGKQRCRCTWQFTWLSLGFYRPVDR